MNPTDMTAVELVTAYSSGELSPVEATQAMLDAITERDRTINSYCLVDEERALEQARKSEERWNTGYSKGLLDGVRAGRRAGGHRGAEQCGTVRQQDHPERRRVRPVRFGAGIQGARRRPGGSAGRVPLRGFPGPAPCSRSVAEGPLLRC